MLLAQGVVLRDVKMGRKPPVKSRKAVKLRENFRSFLKIPDGGGGFGFSAKGGVAAGPRFSARTAQ